MKRLLLGCAGLALLATAPVVAVASTPNVTVRTEQKAADNAPKSKAKGAETATDNTQAEPKADPRPEPLGETGDSGTDASAAPEGPAENLFDESDFADPGADTAPPSATPATASGIFSPTPLWVAAAFIVLLLVVAGMLWRQMAALDRKIRELDKSVRALDQRARAPEPFPLAEAPRQPIARIGGYETGWDGPETERAPPPPREPKPADRAIDRAPLPSPSVAPAVSLVPLQEELARLIANPAMRTADYDDLLRRYGEARGYEVRGDDGSGRLTPNDSDPNRRLTALILTGSEMVALLPSARFIRDFMLYKERLEAGSDVKTLFDLEADGSAHLRIAQLAHGRAGADGTVHSVQRGRLAGFLR